MDRVPARQILFAILCRGSAYPAEIHGLRFRKRPCATASAVSATPPPAPESAPSPLAQQIRRAVIWRSGAQVVAQAVQWASTFLVIRLLSPADYGLFAMTQVVLTLLNMLNGYGLASGLIQQPDASRREIRQLFGMLVVLNVGLGLAQVALAPLAAAYYRQPLVADLLRVQALLYLTTPFVALPYALLARGMDFHRQAAVNVAASIAGAGAALGGALAGWGVWTLVAAPAALFATRAVGMTVAARAYLWPSFDFRGAGHLARYGGLMAASQLFWFAQSQADVLIAGRHFSAHALGIYTTALFLAQIFVAKVVPPLNEVAFSAYARLRDRPGAVAAGFVAAARLVMVVALPFYLGLAAVAEPLVATMLGAKWMEVVPVVRLLALAMPFMTLQVLFTPACDAQGRPGVGVRNGAVGAGLLAVAFLVGVRWGAVGLAWSWLAAYPVFLVASAARALPVIGTRARDLADAVAPPALAAAAMAVAVAGLDAALPPLAPPLRLAVLVATGALFYAAALAVGARATLAAALASIRRRPAQVPVM
jgi:O-antigen/teichoic acid export membrane protein